MNSHVPPAVLYIYSFPFFQSASSDFSASVSGDDPRAFPYHEPFAKDLLVLLSFVFLLNVFREVADYFIHGGLIAEICLGMVYGAPLANILPAGWEATFTTLGYLGLIGIVFEGGLQTNLPLLLSNLPLSTICAATGIILPVTFSFALLDAGYGYSHLEAFAAGAALSSTSLGTTLMALSSVTQHTEKKTSYNRNEQDLSEKRPSREGEPPARISVEPTNEEAVPTLQHTRIGTVLISAAVIDDVIGLVLSSIIPALSVLDSNDDASDSSSQQNITWTIIRPLLSSSLMAVLTPLICRFLLRPVFWWRGFGEQWCAPRRSGKPWGSRSRWMFRVGSQHEHAEENRWGTEKHADAVKVTIMVLAVSAFAAIAFYTGTSVLFGAYLAGCTLTYISHPPADKPEASGTTEDNVTSSDVTLEFREDALSFEKTYASVIGPLQNYILAPLFFASIGYGVPFLSLWKPVVFWRGILYALLMVIAKLAVGLPILLWKEVRAPRWNIIQRFSRQRVRMFYKTRVDQVTESKAPASSPPSESSAPEIHPPTFDTPAPSRHIRSSFAPAAFMGIAMVARGEIGLLIAQIGHTPPGDNGGDERGLLSDEAFLVCIWAILLCTLVGPIGVGYVVRRWEGKIRDGTWG